MILFVKSFNGTTVEWFGIKLKNIQRIAQKLPQILFVRHNSVRTFATTRNSIIKLEKTFKMQVFLEQIGKATLQI
jgi:hypothetical protein